MRRHATTKPPSKRRSAAPRRASTGPVFEPLFPVGHLLADNYEIRGLLGVGGMGEVYEAHDRILNRKVALKVARPGAQKGILRREGQALAAIRHPSIVTVHTMGLHNGVEYLVLERVYGLSLDSVMKQRRRAQQPMLVSEVLDLLISVAEGLSVVHRAGVSHRDVKPANIMVAPGNRIVLMDFGLVVAEVEQPVRDIVFGSLGYMAPEALAAQHDRGEGHLLDVYALGVIAYEMLAGVLPFLGERAEDLYFEQMKGSPRVSSVRADISAKLGDLVSDMLRPDPGSRPQSAEALLWQLRAIRDRQLAGGKEEPFGVLIVDDDEDMYEPLSLYVRALAPAASIETVGTGMAALRAVRKRVPNLLLLDLGLPDMNGVEVCMHLRGMQLGDRCAIVSLSGRASEADVTLLNQLGVEFLVKGPNLRAQLGKIIKRIRPVK